MFSSVIVFDLEYSLNKKYTYREDNGNLLNSREKKLSDQKDYF